MDPGLLTVEAALELLAQRAARVEAGGGFTRRKPARRPAAGPRKTGKAPDAADAALAAPRTPRPKASGPAPKDSSKDAAKPKGKKKGPAGS